MIKTEDTGKAPFPEVVTPQVNELCNLGPFLSFPSENMTTHLNRTKVLDQTDL